MWSFPSKWLASIESPLLKELKIFMKKSGGGGSKNCQFSSYAVCMHQLIEQPVGFSKSIAKIILLFYLNNVDIQPGGIGSLATILPSSFGAASSPLS